MDRRDFVRTGAVGAAGAALGAAVPWLGATSAFAASRIANEKGKPWKFGVMADTQWPKNLDGQNPGTCALGIINLLNAEFVKQGVEFVIQVGDLVNTEDDALNGHAGLRNMPVRANAAKTLYDNGIGFFPCRGNHEGSYIAANEFTKLYPQAKGFGPHVFGATDFSSPFDSLDGVSYSFDFGNVRIVALDQFVRADGTIYNNVVGTNVDNNIVDQQPWVDTTLSTRPKGSHAIVFSHKNLIGQNHVDTLFGPNPAANPAARNAFIASMQANGVRYTLGGHDHMHHRSIVTSPDGASSVKELICSSNSYKFYYPAKPANDAAFDMPALERVIGQELDTIGYYIFTVDGPRVTVDFYSSTIGLDYGDPVGVEDKLTVSPTNTHFYRRERWGYSLNGREFVISQGGSYTPVQDGHKGFGARILGGVNGGSQADVAGRPMVKTVNTGWKGLASRDEAHAASYILTLWGISESLSLFDETLTGLLPSTDRSLKGDTFCLSMDYDEHIAHGLNLRAGHVGIGTRDGAGWVNAVDKNFGGTKRFVFGPWNPGYGLGTYGIDTRTETAWAVVNYDGDFLVSRHI